MIELQKLLESMGIARAVIIDDVFDDTPRPDELNESDWSNFFDDIDHTTETLLSELFDDYKTTSVDDLKTSEKFIAILWTNRRQLNSKSVKYLFEDYENTKAIELSQLNELERRLQSLRLNCSTMGKEFDMKSINADLILIDLFLGFRQLDADVDCAIKFIRELLKNRIENPPLVILMSRSSRLQEKRNEFRDKAGLLGSVFRVVSKADLAKEGALEAILLRLASHYEDAKRVARFVAAWEKGLNRARKYFTQTLRRLDLSDLGQIQALLLDLEGQTLGEYLLDVADRILQHEIESNDETIATALELNQIDLDKYPAPHLVGTPDLQELMYRMIFLHSKRLDLSKHNGNMQLEFGDVLQWKDKRNETFGDNVSLVVSPACDLVRRGTRYVMLLCGVLEELHPRSWSYKADPPRTSIVILPSGDRRWIRWNLKNSQTLSWDELDKLIKQEKKLKRIGRLREIYTIEIQQKLLTHLGRIGRPANLPVSFPVTVSLFYVDSECKARKLDIQEIESAACYVGRDANARPVHRLVLTEQACDQIDQALRVLKDDAVHNASKASLSAVKADRGFFTYFERGEIEMHPEKGQKVKTVGNKTYAIVIRNEEFEEGTQVPGNLRRAALIVKVMDIPEEGVD